MKILLTIFVFIHIILFPSFFDENNIMDFSKKSEQINIYSHAILLQKPINKTFIPITKDINNDIYNLSYNSFDLTQIWVPPKN